MSYSMAICAKQDALIKFPFQPLPTNIGCDEVRNLLICYYFSRPSRSRVCRDHPCTISPAGERLVSPYGSTGKQRSSFPGSFPGPIDDWRDVLRAPVI